MFIVNNSNQDINWCLKEMKASLKATRKMPEELDDIFSVEFVTVDGSERVIIDMMED